MGIGGAGMSGIAQVILEVGCAVSGSDLKRTEITDRLESQGATVFEGHRASNIGDADVVVFSSAVPLCNAEIEEAQKRAIQILHRAEMLNWLMEGKKSIGIAGTHGKTTVSAMIALILLEGGFDPTVVVGGQIQNLGTNAWLGSRTPKPSGEWMVVEADEFDRSFLKLYPTFCVLTSIDLEHLDSYRDIGQIKSAFLEYTRRISKDGWVILCADDKNLLDIASQIGSRTVTYGISEGNDFRAKNVRVRGFEADFGLEVRGADMGDIHIGHPGVHNVRNALGAIAVGLEVKIDFDTIRGSLEGFQGVSRRFEHKGQIAGITVVDDYAHHPTEIKAALGCAKDTGAARVVAVFQPHLYSRTLKLCQDFGRAFQDANIAVITDIYTAREEPIEGVNGELIVDYARSSGHPSVMYINDKDEIPYRLMEIVRPGDLVITLGAGDIGSVAEGLLDLLSNKA